LYQDNGDGIFDPGGGDVQQGPDYVTGTDGLYGFESLDATEKYFVQRAALSVDGNLLPAAVSGLLDPGDVRIVIDAFSENQAVKANPLTPIATSTLNDPMSSILGHERDMYVRLVGGIGEIEMRANAFGVAVLQYDTTSGVVGQGIITWDGIDMSAKPTPSLGLGDLDLTEGGVTEGILLRLGIDSSGAGESIDLRIFDDDPTVFSKASVLFPITDGTASASAFVSFDDFVGPVSPTRVNAIQLVVGQGAKSIDAQLDFMGTLGPVNQDFAIIPEPGTFVLAMIGLLGLLAARRR
jgi:hypothetical protein